MREMLKPSSRIIAHAKSSSTAGGSHWHRLARLLRRAEPGVPAAIGAAGPKLITKLYTCFETPRGRLDDATQAPDHEIAHAHDSWGGSSWFRK